MKKIEINITPEMLRAIADGLEQHCEKNPCHKKLDIVLEQKNMSTLVLLCWDNEKEIKEHFTLRHPA